MHEKEEKRKRFIALMHSPLALTSEEAVEFLHRFKLKYPKVCELLKENQKERGVVSRR